MFMEYPYTRIVFGKGSLKRLGMLASAFGGNKTLLATGRIFSQKHGHLDEALASLSEKEMPIEVFTGIEPDPLDTTVARLVERIKETGADLLIALGGGSVMDATKMANACFCLSAGMDAFYDTDKVTARLKAERKKLLPLISVPTTAGSGSEITRYAVITDTSVNLKRIIVDLALCPSMALVDPELTRTCPPDVTRVSGLDTLSHLLEGYLNFRDVPEEIDEDALRGIRMVLDYLPSALQSPDEINAREQMSRACLIGGMIITFKGTGLPHGFSYSFHDLIPHGSGVTLTLPYSWAYSLPNIQDKTRRLAQVFGVESEGPIKKVAQNAINALRDFYRNVGHPTRLSEIKGIDEGRIKQAAINMKKNPSKLANAPRPVPLEQSEQILTAILEAAYSGEIERLLEVKDE